MTLKEAKEINFPLSRDLPAKVLREHYAGTLVEFQHEQALTWYRNGDGDVRWWRHDQWRRHSK